MRRIVRSSVVWLSLVTALQQHGVMCAQTLPVPAPRMQVVAVEGEAAIHDVRSRKPVDIVVVVRDGNRNPVSGATVTFTLPQQGASGVFPGAKTALTVTSDKNGYASARRLQPNSTPGPFQIEVEAKRGDEAAKVSVPQFNMTVVRSGGSGKWVAVLLAVGGAAAGGAVAAMRGGSTPAAAVPSTPVGITAGAGSVGPPR